MKSMAERIQSIVERLEHAIGIDVRYVLNGGFWAGAGQIAVTLASFALSLIVARFVPKDVYGEYKYVIAMVGIIGSFSLNGIGSAVFQSSSAGYDAALTDGVRSNLRWSTAVFALSIASAAYYLFAGNMFLGVGILIGGCLAPFIASWNLCFSYLNGKKDFGRATVLADFIGTPIPAAAIAFTAILYPQPLALIATYFISNAGVIAYAYWRTIRLYHPAAGAHDPGMLGYAKHLSVMGVLSSIAGNIDQVLLFHYTNAVDLAIYNFATGIVDQTKGPLKQLDVMLQARFVAREHAAIDASMRHKQLLILLAMVLCIVLYIPLAPYLYLILFPAYVAAVPYSQIYVISLLGYALTPFGSYLAAKKKVRGQYMNTIATSILLIVVMAIGAAWWGLWGLIVARVITRIAGAYVQYFVYLALPESRQA